MVVWPQHGTHDVEEVGGVATQHPLLEAGPPTHPLSHPKPEGRSGKKCIEGTNGVKPHILPPELEEVVSSGAAEHKDAAQRPNVCRKAVPADIGPHLHTNLELSKKIANLRRHVVGRSTAGMSIEVEGVLSFFSK